MFVQRLLASFIVAAITVGTMPCMACQSGSRSSVPSGSGARGVGQAFSNPIQSAPIQSAPIQSAPIQSVPTQQFSNPQFSDAQVFSEPQVLSLIHI